MAALRFHNTALAPLELAPDCRRSHVDAVTRLLDENGVLALTPLVTGLYPASAADAATTSGYRSVWVRDNVFVAFALLESGRHALAATVADRLVAFLLNHRHRFDDIISGRTDRFDVRARPHVRFDGDNLAEFDVAWSHAQNDALGYCLWLLARLGRLGSGPLSPESLEFMKLLTRFFEVVRFWEDEDSGHWEETRKVSASSIGVVVAGLSEWLELMLHPPSACAAGSFDDGLIDLTSGMLREGRRALTSILPSECVQPSRLKNRRYDAALLFLAYPLAVEGVDAKPLVDDIRRFLMGPIGVRRYLRDSYWAPDYERLSEIDRTRDYSADLSGRDVLVDDVGLEAQWCIFDPMLSAYYGQRFMNTGEQRDRFAQVLHFNRSLAHITEDWTCPELYYLRDREYVPNPHSPLLWTQANLLHALTVLRATTRT